MYDQCRKNQATAALNFGLHDGHRRRIRRMILQGKLNENVAIQTGNWRENISSANSDWEITGVKTR
jgi:hypothetical protein